MKPQLLVAAAGIPPALGNELVAGFTKTTPITAWLPLDQSKCYTDSYSEKLYERFSEKLRKRDQSNRHGVLSDVNLVLLYLHKEDGSESTLFDRFGTEAMVVPLKVSDFADMPATTGNQRRRIVNNLVREGNRALRYARNLLTVIAEEVTNRDNKTCLLLPRRNFGRDIDQVFNCVREAAFTRKGKEEFEKRLKHTSRSLRTVREGERSYFVGQGGLIFRSPGKAGARHGLAPVWNAVGHDPSCVIRGRMRFGASYDPKFHYDCYIPSGKKRSFPNCHGAVEAVPRRRRHVNIAPNDNVR